MSVLTASLVMLWVYGKMMHGGRCAQPKTDPTFVVNEYYGLWYEFARDPNYFEEGECTTAQYYELPGNYVSVNNHEYQIDNPETAADLYPQKGFYAECS